MGSVIRQELLRGPLTTTVAFYNLSLRKDPHSVFPKYSCNVEAEVTLLLQYI